MVLLEGGGWVSVSDQDQYYPMTQKETAYRVTSRLTIDFQIIMQAESIEEVEMFAVDIHLDKWVELQREWEILDISKNYFLKRVKIEQSESADDSALPSIVTDRE